MRDWDDTDTEGSDSYLLEGWFIGAFTLYGFISFIFL